MKTTNMPFQLRRMLNHELLDTSETRRLIELAKAGDMEALGSIVTHNQKLIYSVAKNYFQFLRNLDVYDLMQEGAVGLIGAVRRYDLTRETAFSTFAMPSIKFNIIKTLIDCERAVRFPRGIDAQLKLFRMAIFDLEGLLGRKPTSDEVLNHVKLPKSNRNPKNTLRLLDISFISFDEPIRGGDLETGGERLVSNIVLDNQTLSPRDNLIAKEELEAVAEDLDEFEALIDELKLSARDKKLVYMNLGLGAEKRTTGKSLRSAFGDISKQRVQQIMSSVWGRLGGKAAISGSDEFDEALNRINSLNELTCNLVSA